MFPLYQHYGEFLSWMDVEFCQMLFLYLLRWSCNFYPSLLTWYITLIDLWILSHPASVLCLVIQSCLTLCDPMGCSLPGSSVNGILQERILEWVAIPFCRESSQHRDGSQVSCIAGRFFTIWGTREALHPFSKSHLIMTYDLIVVLNEIC